MANKHRKISDKKKMKPKIRFNVGMFILIFTLSFASCFALYMVAANIDNSFFDDERFLSSSSQSDSSEPSENSGLSDSDTDNTPAKPPVSNPVSKSDVHDASYLNDCVFVADSLFLDVSVIGKIPNILGNSSLNTSNIISAKIESPNGTLTVHEILKLKKPKKIYIMIGSDLGTNEVSEMVNYYSAFLSNIIDSLPNSSVYVMQIPPVVEDAEASNELVNEYNSKLLSLANNKNVHCLDTNTFLKDNTGALDEKYRSEETGKLNDNGYNAIVDYILNHVVDEV